MVGENVDHKQRLRDAFERILAVDEDRPPMPDGPVRNPVDRFAHLPETTRKWLEGLRAEDLDDWDKILLGYRRGSTIVWFFKWIVITLVGAFMGTVAFGEKVAKVLLWLKEGGH